jgi:hypothetical protein
MNGKYDKLPVKNMICLPIITLMPFRHPAKSKCLSGYTGVYTGTTTFRDCTYPATLKPGCYMVNVISRNNIETKKLIKL